VAIALIGSAGYVVYVVTQVEDEQIQLLGYGFGVMGASFAAIAIGALVAIWRAASRARSGRALVLAIVGGVAALFAIGRFTFTALATLTLLGLVGVTEAHATAAAPGRIERVRYEADGSSTRVIIMLSRPVPYEVRVLGGESTRKSERRVVLDFSNATLAPTATSPIGVENGLLQQIRTGQFTARTARVVLDLASITKHSVEAYEDPPRVVIDIAGTATSAAPTVAAAPPAAAPEPPPARAACATTLSP